VYDVTLGARNGSGSSERAFRIVVADQLALTPPMGWSTWYMAFTNIGDSMVRKQTRALISTGLADHGYAYVEIDDGWNRKPADEPTRNDAGVLEVRRQRIP
jgi:alpha-galactosidase